MGKRRETFSVIRAKETHHVCCFSPRDGEFQIGIFLPVSKKQREFGQESIKDVSRSCDGLGVGIAVDASLKRLSGTNQSFPGLEVIGVIGLCSISKSEIYILE